MKSRLAHLNEVCDKLEAERSTYELKYENLMADDEDRINEKKRAAEGQVDRIERLVSDQDSVIASAEDEESKSERAMEESKRQVKRLKDLKATAKGRTVASKDAAALGDVNANAAARMSEVQHDAMNAAVQATEFLETGVDPNKALADSKGLNDQLKKLDALEKKVHPSERLEKKSTATSKILPDATEERLWMRVERTTTCMLWRHYKKASRT